MRIAFLDHSFANNSAWQEVLRKLTEKFELNNDTVYYLCEENPNDFDVILIDSLDHYLEYLVSLDKETKNRFIEKLKVRTVIQIKHDLKSHNTNWDKFGYENDLLDENTDCFIHLSNFSLNTFKNKYPKSKHELINHPNYSEIPDTIKKEEARKILKIPESSVVFLFFGTPRNYQEIKWMIDFFSKVPLKDKFLIANRNILVGDFLQRQRIRLTLMFNPKIKQYNEKTEDKNIQLFMRCADYGLIPRFSPSTLNSGIFFLKTRFSLPVIIPSSSILKIVLSNFKFILDRDFDYSKKEQYVLNAIENNKVISQENFSSGYIAQLLSLLVWKTGQKTQE
jgi:hypothetical protein